MCDPDLDPGSEKRTLVDRWENFIMANISVIRLKFISHVKLKKAKNWGSKGPY